MVLVTIPLDGRPKRAWSQTQCPDCGNSVWIEVEAGSRVALVCRNGRKFSHRTNDIYCHNHDWAIYAG